jgi:hypothetical protein
VITVWRFADLKAHGICNNYTQLRRLQNFYGFPVGRMVGGQTRTWTEEEVIAWYNARPSAGPQLRGRARAQHERSTSKPTVLIDKNVLIDENVLLACRELQRAFDLAISEGYLVHGHPGGGKTPARLAQEGASGAESLPRITQVVEFKRFTRRALNRALRAPEVVEAMARLERPPSPDRGLPKQ